jgi:two-component system alkaline phosphatase synthesis response regulator PhoP
MKKQILIVEDDIDLLLLTKTRVESAGYTVLTAENAEKALLILEKKKPHLILLDLILPQMQGEELCIKLKSQIEYKDIPILVFTAKSLRLPEDMQAIRADDYITKPFETSALLSKIARLT